MKCSELGVVLGHFVACFCGLGTLYTFGYWIPALLEEFGGSNAQTQVIMGSLQCGFFLGGIPAKWLLRKRGFRIVYATGGAMVVCALLAVSFASELWMTYSIFFAGIGFQASWMVSGALIPRHLSMKDATKYSAFAVTGSGVGTMVWASYARVFLPVLGWRNGLRIMSAVLAIAYTVGAALQRQPPPISKQDSLPEDSGSLLRDRNFCLACLAIAFAGFGYNLPFAVQGVHAVRNGIDAEWTATIYTIFGGFSICGRVLAGVIGAYVNPLHVWAVSMFGISACVAAIALSTSFWAFATANAFLGITSGPMIALLVPALRELIGLARIPDALVMIMIVQAASTLPAPSIAGYLADVTGSFTAGILIAAVGVFIGAVLVTATAVLHSRKHASDSQVGDVEKGQAADDKTPVVPVALGSPVTDQDSFLEGNEKGRVFASELSHAAGGAGPAAAKT